MDSQLEIAADSFSDIEVSLEAHFADRLMDVRDVLAILPGSFVGLSPADEESVSIYIGNVLLANAQVIAVDDRLALRITELPRLD